MRFSVLIQSKFFYMMEMTPSRTVESFIIYVVQEI